ncbi:GntR family transcriptional regulator [Breoghania sp. L-A4]|uniref:GntR family transcriptional regulator n=1 Tax=Breoghania sp. L-A4 TaxID=2304600 RepID=UPI000E358617|nr:GntR family transcriptional regulator [Breoghania sp. L-A4]AXS41524.1 GntR family transcriptional regulator [Breoghania sp. L-A4]
MSEHTRKIRSPGIRRAPMHTEVAEHLRQLIIDGDLAEGERIIEADLSEQLNVSRTPLREAIRMLAREGLVELLPHRGAKVAKVSAAEMRQLFEVISSLERLAAEIVAKDAKPIEIKRLRALHDRMAQHFQAGERREYFARNHQIHLKIVELSGNPILIETHAALMIRARHFRYQALAGQDRWNEAMAEHEAIMQALESGDSELAGRLLKDHVARTAAVVEASILTL